MIELDTVRLLVLTTADDGRPLLVGIQGDGMSWSQESFAPIESDLRTVLDYGFNEPFSLLNASAQRFLDQAAALEATPSRDTRPPASSDYTALQGQLVALLTAMRAFLDHSDRQLKAEFGPNSPERRVLDAAKTRQYDTHAEYRFLYHLRNHMQHHSAFLGPAVGTTRLVVSEKGDESVETSAPITCDRDALLANSKIKKVVRDWLAGQPRWFRIVPHVEQAVKCFFDLRIEFDRIRAPRTLAAAERLDSVLFSKLLGHSGTPGFARFDSERRSRRIEFAPLPMKRFEMMRTSAELAADAQSIGSQEALLIDAARYEPETIILEAPE